MKILNGSISHILVFWLDKNFLAFNVEIRSLYKYQCGLELKNWKIFTIVNQTTTETTIHPEKLEWWNHQTPSFVLIFLFFSYQIASLNNSLTDKLKAHYTTNPTAQCRVVIWHCSAGIIFRTRAIIGRSWFEAALVYKPRILNLKNEEFPFLVHKLFAI